jgi:hypothetical protein
MLPYVEYRDNRLSYCAVEGERKGFIAIDDGGIQYKQIEGDFQVAIMEAKGDFQKVENGVPILTDDLLAQVVGEAVALRVSQTARLYPEG